jgi:hypothetical protein
VLACGALELQTLFNFRVNSSKKLFLLKIGARFTIGKFLALPRACFMDSTSSGKFSVQEKNTGTILFHLKSIPTFKICFSHFTITYAKMTGNSVNIFSRDKKQRAG